MIVQDREGMDLSAVRSRKVASEIHLPELVRPLLLEAGPSRVFLGLGGLDQPVPVQDRLTGGSSRYFGGLHGELVVLDLPEQKMADLVAAPCRMSSPYVADDRVHAPARSIERPMRSTGLVLGAGNPLRLEAADPFVAVFWLILNRRHRELMLASG